MKVMEPRIASPYEASLPSASRLTSDASSPSDADANGRKGDENAIQSEGDNDDKDKKKKEETPTKTSDVDKDLINHAPQIIGDTMNNTIVSVTENEMIGRMVAVVSSSDPDNDLVSVHLLPKGNEESTFALVEGALTVAKRIDYERQSRYDLTLALHDGMEFTYFNVSLSL